MAKQSRNTVTNLKVVLEELVNALATVAQLRAALESAKAAIGDRLLGRGPLSKEYANSVTAQINRALAETPNESHRSRAGRAAFALLFLIWPAAERASGQTTVHLQTQSRQVDFSGAVSTRVHKTGTTLPAACQTGETYFKTDAPAGQNLYGCSATNVWSQLSGGSGSGGGGSSPDAVTAVSALGADNRVVRSDGAARAVQASGCTLDDADHLLCPGSVGSGDGVATGYLEALAGPAPGNPVQVPYYRLYFDQANSGRLTDRNATGGTRVYLTDPGAGGLAARTAAGALTARTLTGTAGEIAVTNGDGVAGNPVLALAGSIDLTAKTATKPSKAGTTPPATCAAGETFLDTDAAPHAQWLVCSAENTWTAQGAITLDPSGLVEWDDFLPGSSAAGAIGKLGWVSTGTVTDNDPANLFAQASLPGTYLLRSSSSTWTDLRLAVNKYGPLLPDVQAQVFESHFIVFPRTLTGVHQRVGWNRQDFGAADNYENTSLSMIYRGGTDTNWMYQACHAGTCVAVDSGVAPAADTVYRLRIRATVAGVYRFAVSTGGGAFSTEKTVCASGCDATLTAISSHLSPYFAIQSLDASAKEALVDYFGYKLASLAR